MFARFLGWESLASFAVLALVGASVGAVAGLQGWLIAALAGVTAFLLFLPATAWLQEYLLAWNTERGRYAEAVALGERLLATTPGKRRKLEARVDLSLVHVACANHQKAREQLEICARGGPSPIVKAIVEGNLALCLGHLGLELERAQELADRARRNVSEDDAAIFDYFRGLVLHKRGLNTEAAELISQSLTRDPFELDPAPGERRCVLGEVYLALNEPAAARPHLEQAAKVVPASPFTERAAAKLAAG